MMSGIRVKKIKKVWLRDPVILLKQVGATNGDLTRVFPSCVTISRADMKILEKHLRKTIRRDNPQMGRKAIAREFDDQIVMYAPLSRDGIKDGYAIISEARLVEHVEREAEAENARRQADAARLQDEQDRHEAQQREILARKEEPEVHLEVEMVPEPTFLQKVRAFFSPSLR